MSNPETQEDTPIVPLRTVLNERLALLNTFQHHTFESFLAGFEPDINHANSVLTFVLDPNNNPIFDELYEKTTVTKGQFVATLLMSIAVSVRGENMVDSMLTSFVMRSKNAINGSGYIDIVQVQAGLVGRNIALLDKALDTILNPAKPSQTDLKDS